MSIVVAIDSFIVRPLADGGEGRLDGQTVFGKAPTGVAEIAKKYDCNSGAGISFA